MKLLLLYSLLFMGQIAIGQKMTDKQINGKWIVDLRPNEDSEPYLKDFIIKINPNGEISGEFYDTEYSNGKINKNWDRIYFAFTTKDASSNYYHSGYFEDNQVFGMTYSPERSFIMPWTGNKEE